MTASSTSLVGKARKFRRQALGERVYGFGGMHDYEGEFDSYRRLPSVWSRLRFPLNWRGHVEVDGCPGEVRYRLLGVDGRARARFRSGTLPRG